MKLSSDTALTLCASVGCAAAAWLWGASIRESLVAGTAVASTVPLVVWGQRVPRRHIGHVWPQHNDQAHISVRSTIATLSHEQRRRER